MSKKDIETLIKMSNKIKMEVIEGSLENPKPGSKWKVWIEGEFKDISNTNSSGFNKKQMEQLGSLMNYMLQPIISRLDSIDNRLEIVEKDVKTLKKDVKEMKNTPTMKNELKK